MKDKSKILYERALITCLIMLFICIIFKLFGFNYFDLNTDIPILKEIDNVVMNSEVLSFIYSFIFKFINGYLMCCIARKETKFNVILLGPICVGSMILSKFCGNSIIMLYDTLSLYIMCFDKTNWEEYCSVILLNIFYQMISLFIRSLGVQCSDYPLVIAILLNLDYYIMLILTYLYLSKGGYTLCGIVHASFSFLATKLWKERSENYSNKEGK